MGQRSKPKKNRSSARSATGAPVTPQPSRRSRKTRRGSVDGRGTPPTQPSSVAIEMSEAKHEDSMSDLTEHQQKIASLKQDVIKPSGLKTHAIYLSVGIGGSLTALLILYAITSQDLDQEDLHPLFYGISALIVTLGIGLSQWKAYDQHKGDVASFQSKQGMLVVYESYAESSKSLQDINLANSSNHLSPTITPVTLPQRQKKSPGTRRSTFHAGKNNATQKSALNNTQLTSLENDLEKGEPSMLYIRLKWALGAVLLTCIFGGVTGVVCSKSDTLSETQKLLIPLLTTLIGSIVLASVAQIPAKQSYNRQFQRFEIATKTRDLDVLDRNNRQKITNSKRKFETVNPVHASLVQGEEAKSPETPPTRKLSRLAGVMSPSQLGINP